MIRNLLIVVGFLLCFILGGVGISRYLQGKGQTPFLTARATDLAGRWQNKGTTLSIEADGEGLKVDRAAYVRDGNAARWVEKSPQGKVPRILEWNGTQLLLTVVDDQNQRRSESLTKVQK